MTKYGDLGNGNSAMVVSPDGSVVVSLPLSMDYTTTEENSVLIKEMEEEEQDEAKESVDINIMTDIYNRSDEVGTDENLIQSNHATLQSLLASPVSPSSILTSTNGMQVVALPTSNLISLTGENSDRYLQVLSTNNGELNGKYIGIIAIANPSSLNEGLKTESGETNELLHTGENMTAILMSPPAPIDLPLDCPQWAVRLHKCEEIGDSYRGYVENEADLDLILTLHKQQTNSFWGTRQSPSTAKESKRLMWKSQYVPFDGIPFINAGSRAVVMECQFGPRRKGIQGKKTAVPNNSLEFKQTCPARIYIKKVRKFPSYAVNLSMDKKSIRLAMDKAFHELRGKLMDTFGEERYYVQLPTDKAHDYHEIGHSKTDLSNSVSTEPEPPIIQIEKQQEARIHPEVLEKIRQLVASGETKLYTIRKRLRSFVVCDLFQGTGHVPERHDLTMFPTVNDLKNHIHQALKDIESGLLQPTVSMESEVSVKEELSSMWSGANVPSSSPIAETVTVTLAPNSGEDGQHFISRIETNYSDGSTQVNTHLAPEMAQILSRLHPTLFPSGYLLQVDNAQNELVAPEQTSLNELDNPIDLDTGLSDTSPIIGLDTSSHLVNMVDMESSSHLLDRASSSISPITSTDESQFSNYSNRLVLSNIMDEPASSPNPGLGNLNLPSLNLPNRRHLTVYRTPSISELASTGNRFSILSGTSESDTITLVSGHDSSPALNLVPDDSSLHLEGDEAEEHLLDKPEQKMKGSEKITLHIISDQEIGMARLENKVSDL